MSAQQLDPLAIASELLPLDDAARCNALAKLPALMAAAVAAELLLTLTYDRADSQAATHFRRLLNGYAIAAQIPEDRS